MYCILNTYSVNSALYFTIIVVCVQLHPFTGREDVWTVLSSCSRSSVGGGPELS